jgi:Ca-activated chloride channel family protein
VIDWRFADVGAVHFVWIALALSGALAFLEFRSRGDLDAFLTPTMQARLTSRATASRTATRLALILLSMICAVGALMRPQARGERETVNAASASGEIVFAVDTSRSMLAEDAAPNRLARAKAEIAQMTSRLEGQRVGLVAFAGRAVLLCPLTPDRAFFASVLSTVDTRVAGRGGTKIGEAIKVALRGFAGGGGARLIVLITDGDDQDPYSEEAAKAARDAGVKIVAVGLGSEEGSEITLRDPDSGAKSTLTDSSGKPVISKLNADQLRKIALVTEGAYIPAGTSAVDLDSIMESYVQPIVRAAAAAAVRQIPAERYPPFVAASLVFLLASLWVGAGAGERKATA